MDKLKMAHEYLRDIIKASGGNIDVVEMPEAAWKLADAMQAEADERINKERPDVLLTKDKDGNCLHFHHEFGHKKCMDCGASLEEWQPDWSQAPDGVTSWHMNKDNRAYWVVGNGVHLFENQGRFLIEAWCSRQTAPSFNYQGNWQDSLRKRPSNI